MSERQARIANETKQDLGGPIKHITLIDTSLTYSMTPTDHILFVETVDVTGDGVAIVTLPSYAEAAGKFYYIKAPNGSTGGDLSIYEKETGAELATYGDMDADNDNALFFCTGQAWVVAFDGVA